MEVMKTITIIGIETEAFFEGVQKACKCLFNGSKSSTTKFGCFFFRLIITYFARQVTFSLYLGTNHQIITGYVTYNEIFGPVFQSKTVTEFFWNRLLGALLSKYETTNIDKQPWVSVSIH